MYSTCLRCDGSLGTNTELTHLRIGRRIAFDRTRGRLWVICPHCGQWNLVPLEERWEALEESEQVAQGAEARASGASIGFARTEQGLELLQVGGMSSTDIANWRYGRRLQRRQSLLLWIAGALLLLGIVLGVRAGVATHSPGFGIYIAGLAAIWLGFVWHHPPRLWLRLPPSSDVERRMLWPWQLQDILLQTAEDSRPTVIVPRGGQRIVLRQARAAAFLASILPKLNGADCASVSISDAVDRVTAAEEDAHRLPGERRRKKGHRKDERERNDAPHLAPWEILAAHATGTSLIRLDPERRVALEMAVTEECERADARQFAADASTEWVEEEEVAAIADDLLLPPEVTARLAEEKARLRQHATKKEAG